MSEDLAKWLRDVERRVETLALRVQALEAALGNAKIKIPPRRDEPSKP